MQSRATAMRCLPESDSCAVIVSERVRGSDVGAFPMRLYRVESFSHEAFLPALVSLQLMSRPRRERAAFGRQFLICPERFDKMGGLCHRLRIRLATLH